MRSSMKVLAMIGTQELVLLLLVVLLVFGSSKLPALARALGSSVTEFRRGLRSDPGALPGPEPGAQRPPSDASARS